MLFLPRKDNGDSCRQVEKRKKAIHLIGQCQNKQVFTGFNSVSAISPITLPLTHRLTGLLPVIFADCSLL